MSTNAEVSSQKAELTSPRHGLVYALVEKALNSRVGAVIFACILKAPINDYTSLCEKVDPKAIKLVEKHAKDMYPVAFSHLRASAIDSSIRANISNGNIREIDGHAVARY